MRVGWLAIQDFVRRAAESGLRTAIVPALLCALSAGALAQTGAVPGGDRRIRPQGDPPAVSALPAKGKRFTLLIGVDEYQAPNISRLFGAANDARAMKQALVQYGGFPADHAVVLASGEAPTLAPTRANILIRLRNRLSIVPKDGLLLFQFSGHGIERNRRPFLLPADAQLQDNPRVLEQLAVSLEFVRTTVEEVGIAQVLVLLDACRNEPDGRTDDDNLLTETFVDGLRFERRNAGVRAFATLARPELSTMREPAVVPPPSPVQVRGQPRAGERMEALDLGRGVKMEFVYIPAGTFWMGCSPGDSECGGDENPRHRVTITNGFELGKYEVTQAEWEAVMGTNPSSSKGARRPVEMVSWLDAQALWERVGKKWDPYLEELKKGNAGTKEVGGEDAERLGSLRHAAECMGVERGLVWGGILQRAGKPGPEWSAFW